MAPASIPPPWDAWALDKQFLAALDKWLEDHPDQKPDTVLKSICTAIDSGKDLMGFIPDSPLPARSLVQGLGGLVKLGNVCCAFQIFVHRSHELNPRLSERPNLLL
jgi:hypothetical protein